MLEIAVFCGFYESPGGTFGRDTPGGYLKTDSSPACDIRAAVEGTGRDRSEEAAETQAEIC